MKLNEHIRKINETYSSVSIKKVACIKQFELYHISFKNKREQNTIVLVYKKNKEVVKIEKVRRDNIDTIVSNFKKNIKAYSLKEKQLKKELMKTSQEHKVKNIKEYAKKIKVEQKKALQKEKKKISDSGFKSEKEKKDAIMIFMIASIILDFFKETNKVSLKNDVATLKNNVDLQEKKLFELYLHLVKQLQQIGVLKGRVKYDIIKANADKTLDIVFKKYNNKIDYYLILMGLYLIDYYKSEVKNKTLSLKNSKEIYETLKKVENDLINEGSEKYRENSQKLAYDVGYQLFGIKLLTKQESKEFFKKQLKKGG